MAILLPTQHQVMNQEPRWPSVTSRHQSDKERYSQDFLMRVFRQTASTCTNSRVLNMPTKIGDEARTIDGINLRHALKTFEEKAPFPVACEAVRSWPIRVECEVFQSAAHATEKKKREKEIPTCCVLCLWFSVSVYCTSA